MWEERKIFCIKITYMEALLVPYTLGKTVAFPILREFDRVSAMDGLLWFFFYHFLIFRKGNEL